MPKFSLHFTYIYTSVAGLITPTSGSVVIGGNDIQNSLDEIRKSLGVCPQHNTLFDRLTVSEHLTMFGTFKVTLN